ncbi:MAG: hypothetical protein JJE22_17115 [Bacteroidia bacterium]|nr:hypothetical protein [Bacteroidia bacterium]
MAEIPDPQGMDKNPKQISSGLKMEFFIEVESFAPKLNIRENPNKAQEVIGKKS